MTHNEQSILVRLHFIREDYEAHFMSPAIAEVAASELIWMITNEENMGHAYINRIYEGVHPGLRTGPRMRKPFQK